MTALSVVRLCGLVAFGGLTLNAQVTRADQQLQRVEASVVDVSLGDRDAQLHANLAQLMAAFDVPGLSIAIVSNFQIVAAKGYGVVAAGSNMPVGVRTLFQAASISKPVTAAGALALVEQRKLSLDGDVNDKLRTWKVPENEFTKDQKVTLRRLISHIAGLNVHGFGGYPVDTPLPTLMQILNGEKPANSPPIRVGFVPGSKESYSGGGIVIEQQLMMDATGKTFRELMREMVLTKAGMTDSDFDQPLREDRQALAASGTHQDGSPVHGGWYVYPELAPAGLWTTPTDLATFAIEIARSRNGVSNRVLSKAMTETMLTRWPDGGAQCFHMDADNPGQFSHNGENEGFEGILNMNWKTGDGLVLLANSENGEFLWDLITRAVAREYGWNYKFAGPPKTLLLIARMRGAQAALREFDAMKAAGAPEDQAGEKDLNAVGYAFLSRGDNRDAIAVFQRNVRDYPQSANVYDSLGEAYIKAGEKALAIESYENSLQLNPSSENAKKRLKDLGQAGMSGTDFGEKKATMTRQLCFTILAAAMALSAASRQDYKVEDRMPVSHTFAGDKTINVDLVNGSIAIVGDGGNTIRVSGERVIHALNQEQLARAKNDDVLDINEKEGVAQLYENGPFRGNDSHSSDYHGFHESSDRQYDVSWSITAHVPRATALQLRSVNGGVTAQDTSGTFEVRAVNGAVGMTNIAGSGTISAVNGANAVSFSENPKADTAITSVNGKIEVTFQPNLSVDFNLKTVNGAMYTDFESTALASPPPAAGTTKENGKFVYKTRGESRIRVGAGGPQIRLETVNGSIQIRKQTK